MTDHFNVFAVTLYNCSVGRQDCSLCKNADHKYSCVWCAKHKACVYEKLCMPSQPGSQDPYDVECPNPEITDVSSRRCMSEGLVVWRRDKPTCFPKFPKILLLQGNLSLCKQHIGFSCLVLSPTSPWCPDWINSFSAPVVATGLLLLTSNCEDVICGLRSRPDSSQLLLEGC